MNRDQIRKAHEVEARGRILSESANEKGYVEVDFDPRGPRDTAVALVHIDRLAHTYPSEEERATLRAEGYRACQADVVALARSMLGSAVSVRGDEKSDRETEAVRLLHWREGEIEDAKAALLPACGELSDYDTIVDAAKTAARNHIALDQRYDTAMTQREALQPELTQLIVEARLAAQLLGRGRNRDHARALQLRCDRIASILGGGP